MEAKIDGGNAGEKENQENMGIPDRGRDNAEENVEDPQRSLPSDGPVSQSEGTVAPDLDKNVEDDDSEDLFKDSTPG